MFVEGSVEEGRGRTIRERASDKERKNFWYLASFISPLEATYIECKINLLNRNFHTILQSLLPSIPSATSLPALNS